MTALRRSTAASSSSTAETGRPSGRGKSRSTTRMLLLRHYVLVVLLCLSSSSRPPPWLVSGQEDTTATATAESSESLICGGGSGSGEDGVGSCNDGGEYESSSPSSSSDGEEGEKIPSSSPPSSSSSSLVVVVVGASGDLAKKKTYPSLFRLFAAGMLPDSPDIDEDDDVDGKEGASGSSFAVYGFARSNLTDDGLRERIRPYLSGLRGGRGGGGGGDHERDDDEAAAVVDAFLSRCYYVRGSGYGDVEAFGRMAGVIREYEDSLHLVPASDGSDGGRRTQHNRLFYLAVPPDVFAEAGSAIRKTLVSQTSDGYDKHSDGGDERRRDGWSRIVVEKPFGRSLPSCDRLLTSLSSSFSELDTYRIDHYLGKDVVRTLPTLRFENNVWFDRLLHKDVVESVQISFKEPFGTEGRGGYFDRYGIIRDVMQNHLLQVLSLLAMERPPNRDHIDGFKESDYIADWVRDEKVRALKSIPPIVPEDVLLGQYHGYSDDPTIHDKNTTTATYAAVRMWVRTPRWDGVPFVLVAGKALDERLVEVRVRFRDAPFAAFGHDQGRSSSFSSGGSPLPQNELVLRIQPDESIYLTTNVQSPGFGNDGQIMNSKLELNYRSLHHHDHDHDRRGHDHHQQHSRHHHHQHRPHHQPRRQQHRPDAYSRLLLDVIHGTQSNFVRDDELRAAWEIFDPALIAIEGGGGVEKRQQVVKVERYERGTDGPESAEEWIRIKSKSGSNMGHSAGAIPQ